MALLAELAVPSAAFALHDAVETTPSLALELERVIPTNESTAEYLWARANGSDDLEETLLADPSVAALDSIATADEGTLYRVEWDSSVTPLFDRLETGEETLVRGELRSGSVEWTLSFRFASRGALEDFRQYCRRRDVDFRLVRLTDAYFAHSTGYDVSPKQREAMILAHSEGYFEIPRGTTLSAVADELGISTRAASERLRRGQSNLIENTLLAGATTEFDDSAADPAEDDGADADSAEDDEP